MSKQTKKEMHQNLVNLLEASGLGKDFLSEKEKKEFIKFVEEEGETLPPKGFKTGLHEYRFSFSKDWESVDASLVELPNLQSELRKMNRGEREELKIYIVTDQKCGDETYRIKAVFTDEKQAELYCAHNGGQIEPRVADKQHFDESKEVYVTWGAHYRLDGRLESFEKRYTFNDSSYVLTSGSSDRISVYITLAKTYSEEDARELIQQKFDKWKEDFEKKSRWKRL